ncbi:PorP/SprF family type IX secretion system membrane protein [Williamwhitmania taraxaci]|uniref:Type IX secretion system membrane protein, PorP/SprF family n=1 Tax=Williamwhitmania taraxaci TaxID=1640674 RepID=A0A1G6L4B8_9BACT|nr:type IX secretion system membrane protein PorP/SprF [Williamwhitmania taraxaci]SDC37536.1 type IX secretion system membrane protein, PorP/SprF family [Williamwhitmania taraxaci]
MRTYIKHILVGLSGFLLTSNLAFSQQEPQYTQYMFNTVSVNPAYAGTTNALNFVALSRMQWVGLKGAPVTHTFSMHTPINGKKAGVGLSVISDKIGPVNNFYLSASYSYRVPLNEKVTLSLGLKGGIYNYYVGLNRLSIIENNDVAFNQNETKKFHPNLGLGAYFYADRWYAGLAIPTLIQSDLNKDNVNTNKVSELKRHYFLMAGYVFPINSDWDFKPSFIEKVVTGSPLSTDLTAQFLYRKAYWMGATYRIGDALAFLFEAQVSEQITIGYSYDITTSKLAGHNRGSHEILLSYSFEKLTAKKIKSPRYF